MSPAPSSSGGSAISGLGITFHPLPIPVIPQRSLDGDLASMAQHSVEAPPRQLRHSMSHDGALNKHGYRAPDMTRYSSEYSVGGQYHARQSDGKGSDLHYYQPTHLSPLSEFEHSSESEAESHRGYTPASLSSLPSSTNSAAISTFYQQTPYAQLKHAQSMYNLHQPPMEEQPHPVTTDYYAYHKSSAVEPTSSAARPSRLPAFLKERRLRADNMRPQSMLELNQLYVAQAVLEPAREAHNESYDVSSPNESVPSSAGGLQRRHLERQLQEQHRLFQEEKKRLTKSTVERRGPSHGDRRVDVVRQRSRSMCATDRIPRPDTAQEHREPDAPRPSRPKSDRLEPLRTDSIVPQQSRDNGPRRSTSACDLSSSGGAGRLARHSTLLTAGANPVRRSKELDHLLAPSAKKRAVVASLPDVPGSPAPSSSASAAPSSSAARHSRSASHQSSRVTATSSASAISPIMLEQGKTTTKARVELDLMLATSLIVEGGELKGSIEVRVRKPKDEESEVWVGYPKLRVVGFEEVSSPDTRYIFYHHASPLSIANASQVDPASLPCFDSAADAEGFCKGRVGQYKVPFKLHLPPGKGAKGCWKNKQGAVRYIVIASMKLKSKSGEDRSIAHFYRHVEVFPYLNPAVILAPASKPLRATESKSLFMGGSGHVKLSAEMHRATWVAGQRCYVDIKVDNKSSKKIKSLTLSLVRTTTIFRPQSTASLIPSLENDVTAQWDANACQTQTTRKKIAETTLEMGKKGKGVTARGSWIGVEAGETAEFAHSLLVPHDALSITRGRHVEVAYAVKVSVGGSLSADVSADIPVRIVNFVSLDPPPGHVGESASATSAPRPLAERWSTTQLRDLSNNVQPVVRSRDPPTLPKKPSVDSLRLQDLDIGSSKPGLSRIASMDSIRTADLSRAQSMHAPASENSVAISHADVPASIAPVTRERAVVGKALERQLTHQMSLECISSAIASATARRQGHQRTESSLRSIPSSAEVESWEDSHRQLEDEEYQWGDDKLDGDELQPMQLDDLSDDDYDSLDHRTTTATETKRHAGDMLPHVDESSHDDALATYAELNALMQSRFSDDDEAGEDEEGREEEQGRESKARRPSVISSASTSNQLSAPRPSSSQSGAIQTARRSDIFAFATPSSPVKANVELVVPRSPARRSAAASPDCSSPRPRSAHRPLPLRPDASPSFSSPTKASAAKEQFVERQELAKRPSTTSLKRTTAVTRRPSSRSLADAYGVPDGRSRPSSPVKQSPAMQTQSPTIVSDVQPSPTISVVSSSPVAPPHSPRKVKTPTESAGKSLRSARSMHELRSTPLPVPSRKPTVLPSVRSKIAALETRQATLQRFKSTTGRASELSRASSITSTVSDATSFADLQRANSMASFKAPILRRKLHEPMP